MRRMRLVGLILFLTAVTTVVIALSDHRGASIQEAETAATATGPPQDPVTEMYQSPMAARGDAAGLRAAGAADGVGGASLPLTHQAAQRRPRVIAHRVEPGDTLWDLATRYGTDITTLVAINTLRDGDVLQVGQELRILTVPGLLYRVKSGDTLSGIAQRYGIPLADIEATNQVTADRPLSPGQELILAGARPLYIWPLTGRITSAYGPRWGRIHQGVDIAGSFGDAVVAARSGRVTVAGWSDIYGYYIVINHGDGVQTLYAHHNALLVTAGEYVETGEQIGRVGSTGYSTGPHLHFEVIEDGEARDPLDYLAGSE